MIKEIKNQDKLLAIIIPNNFSQDGSTFVTPNEMSQQLAYMKYPKGKLIQAHQHNHIERKIYDTKEILYIKKGSLLVNFFNDEKKLVEHTIINSGDLILLVDGGHGFEVLEDIEMIEIKQGPYLGDQDKVKF